MPKPDRLSTEYQRAVDQFVHRHIHYCVSTLISNLATDASSHEYYDNIISICVQDDWQTPAEEAGWEHFTDEFGANCYRDNHDGKTWACANWQELCEAFDIDPYQTEAYEHWIISEWLADKLLEHGEMVCKDIHGLTVWGRPTTGQAIHIDDVICKIYDAPFWVHRPAQRPLSL